jgi:hypothetical protein
MSATDISRHFANNKSAKEIARIIGILASQGRTEKRPVKGASGRTKDRWYAVTHATKNETNEFNEDRGDTTRRNGQPGGLSSLNSLVSSFLTFIPNPSPDDAGSVTTDDSTENDEESPPLAEVTGWPINCGNLAHRARWLDWGGELYCHHPACHEGGER